jgi:hypothetical protein
MQAQLSLWKQVQHLQCIRERDGSDLSNNAKVKQLPFEICASHFSLSLTVA